MTDILSRLRSRPLQVRLPNQLGGMMSRLRNRLVAECRIERLLPRELWVMPEDADKQEDDQDAGGDRNPRSQPMSGARSAHQRNENHRGLLPGVEYSAIVSTVEK